MDTVQTLSVAMQQEMQRVLMDSLGLSSTKLDRLEAMSRAAREFLKAASPTEFIVPALSPAAEKIQAERFRKLGFTPELVDFHNKTNQARARESMEALTRLAEVHGVGEDDEDDDAEVEEVVVPVALQGQHIWLSIGLIDRVIQVLGGSDGDVVDHLIDLVNDCRMRHEDVKLDAILPIDLGLVHLIAAGLNDAEVLKAHPEAELLANEISSCVLAAAAALNQETVNQNGEARS